MKRIFMFLVITTFALQVAAISQQPIESSVHSPDRDTTVIDEKGTAHVTRVVPLPETISPEAQATIIRRGKAGVAASQPATLAEQRERTDSRFKAMGDGWGKMFPNKLENTQLAGVPVRMVTPDGMPAKNKDKILLEIHGGGFYSDSGSYTETIPVAGLTKIRSIGVLYRMAPENPFPAGIDDVVAVYKELLKTYKPAQIAIYGTSAGAVMTAEVAARLKALHLPLPAALGVFSGFGDFDRFGDSQGIFGLGGFSGITQPPNPQQRPNQDYVGKTDRKDPILSPIYSDLHGLPPTLFISSERDALLSGTINLHRAFLDAGVDARLIVFDGLHHAFWYDPVLPESLKANQYMAAFFVQQLNRVP